MSEGNHFITYNSLISICILSEDFDNSQYAKFLYAEENLEHSFYFKTCKKAFLDYSDIKGCLFYIRNIEECISNYSFSKNQENVSKELGFLNKDKINKNSLFYLQHMASKKFVCIERNYDNEFVLKLEKNINNAAKCKLMKKNQKRNSRESMHLNDIFHFSVYIEDDDLYFYIKDDKNPLYKNNNNNYRIILDNHPSIIFCLFNQQWFIRETKEIYSGHLINIVFSSMIENKKEQLMLSVSRKKENDEKDFIGLEKPNYDEFYLTGIPFTNELSEHILNNSFWIIEDDSSILEENKKIPLEVKKEFRIKNLNTGLYLNIRENVNNIIEEYSYSEEYSDIVYEFYLVDEINLNKNARFYSNFMLFNYSFEILSNEIMDDGEYILRGDYHKSKINVTSDYEYYFKPISINMNAKKRLEIKQEDDFIFKIKKVDYQRGIQISYVKKIMDTLYKVINDDDMDNDDIIIESIKFFNEYLSNIDFSFRDEKYEYNIPIKERQILLFKFEIVELIDKSLEFYLKMIKNENKQFLNAKTEKMLNELLINIIKFFKNLSSDNEVIKQTIYIISLNKLIKLSDYIFGDNSSEITILINFIFNLIDDSEALQDYFLGGGNILKSQISSNENLKNYKLDNLLRESKILRYIEKNYNYLLYYEKLIGLNKVQYKRKEIESHVKSHIESVKKNKHKTYKEIISQIIQELTAKIRKHAILLDKFINTKNDKKKSKKRSLKNLFKKNSFELKKEEEQIKEFEEKTKKEKMRRSVTKPMNKIQLEETQREDTTNKFLESEEDENEIDSKNKINLFNKDIINDENELNDKKENKNKKGNIINLKRAATSGFNFFKKKKVDFSGKKSNDGLKNISYFERIKSNFSIQEGKNNSNKKRFLGSILGNLGQSDMNVFQKAKTKSLTNASRRNSIKIQILPYKDYLKKLGEIYSFIQFFTALDLDKSLFIKEHLMNSIEEELHSGGNLDPSLFIFFKGDKIEEGKNWFLDRNRTNLYLFYLYNMFFPDVKSDLREKIKKNETIKGSDIINEIKDDNIEQKDYSDEDDESKYKNDMIEEFNKIDDDLCTLYSIFQCLLNQFINTIFDLFFLKSNFYLNFLSLDDIIKSKEHFSKIIKNLLSQMVFLNKKYLENLYESIKSNSSLLNKELDLGDGLLQNNKLNNKNLGDNGIENFSNKDIMLIEYIFSFSKNYDKIKYLYEKIFIHKYIKNLVDYEKSKPKINMEENLPTLEDKIGGDEEKSKYRINLEEKLKNKEKEKKLFIKEKLKSLTNYLNN